MHPVSTLAGNMELKFSFLLMETFTLISMKMLLKSKDFDYYFTPKRGIILKFLTYFKEAVF